MLDETGNFLANIYYVMLCAVCTISLLVCVDLVCILSCSISVCPYMGLVVYMQCALTFNYAICSDLKSLCYPLARVWFYLLKFVRMNAVF